MYLDVLFLINALEGTLLALPVCIKLACALHLDLSVTNLLPLLIVILKPVPLQDVFLLVMQSVGILTCITDTLFCLQILFSLVFTSIYILWTFFALFILCFPLIGYLAVVKHSNKLTELNVRPIELAVRNDEKI
jgi:hypothetical protein